MSLDAAFEVGNRALDEYQKLGAPGVNWTGLWIPEMHALRQDPRFQSFFQRLMLLDYYKVKGPPDGCRLAEGRLLCAPPSR